MRMVGGRCACLPMPPRCGRMLMGRGALFKLKNEAAAVDRTPTLLRNPVYFSTIDDIEKWLSGSLLSKCAKHALI